ncbi:hypothetical protein AK812_SmicGene24027 [Symbiodinium microadriaticum]|uniref:Uncharacterized protein n=1 Tax=Symbiodinium microadriaticum TaxID=2951 RepID=A0A1Q9DFY7_SYMMI|nr:hypothetical protein AK812_SmicGene24027 [Symbiodinium microadriaticum]
MDTFMQSAGIESRGEFAFYFASWQEAEAEAGRAVADAWEAAHAECQRGLAPMANARHCACLVDILRKSSRFASQLQGGETASKRVLDAIVNPILASAEETTLRKVVRTWSELCEWAQRQGACVADLSAVQMAQFVLDSPAKSRVLPSLCFMRKRLHFAPELDLAHSFRAARSAAIGHGARQVPVAQPAMVLLLERQLVAAYKNGHPDWLGFLLTWCQVTGCVRFVHLQRSRLIQMDQRTLLFECLRGKQRHLRAGFLWSCPRFSITEVDFGGMFLEALQKLEKPEAVKCVGFRAISGEELAPQAVRSQIGLAMSAILPPAESRRVSSKCWRQVPVTLSLLGGLDATEVCALGNWLEKAPHGQSAMPWRYHRAKIKQATILKHQLKFVLKELIFDQACSSWDSADAESIRASFKRAHEVVAAELAEAPELVYQWRGAHCMTGEQAFRLRCSSSAWLRQGSAGSYTEGARKKLRDKPRVILSALPADPKLEGKGPVEPLPSSPCVALEDGSVPKPLPKRRLILDRRPVTQPGPCAPQSRQEGWSAVRQCLFNTLAAGDSVYIHCRTGAQYGPCLAAVVVAHVRGVSFDAALDHMRNIRAITPEPVITRDKCGELFKWLRRQADSCAAPPLSISLPLQLLASWRERSAIHALAAKSSRAVPQPACRWRQAQEGQRAAFKEGVIWIDDILEGVALERPWCKACVAMLPAGIQCSLRTEHTVEFR